MLEHESIVAETVNSFIREKRFEDAVSYILENKVSFSEVDYFINLGFCQYKSQLYEESIISFSSAISIIGDSPNTTFLRASSYLELDLYEDALLDFQTVSKISPNTFDAYTGMGVCYESLGDVLAAIESYKIAYGLNPHSLVAQDRLKALQSARG